MMPLLKMELSIDLNYFGNLRALKTWLPILFDLRFGLKYNWGVLQCKRISIFNIRLHPHRGLRLSLLHFQFWKGRRCNLFEIFRRVLLLRSLKCRVKLGIDRKFMDWIINWQLFNVFLLLESWIKLLIDITIESLLRKLRSYYFLVSDWDLLELFLFIKFTML